MQFNALGGGTNRKCIMIERIDWIMNYDVIIVGAGPAGATAAKFLAEKGEKVLLIDKDAFPRDKPCGGGLSIRILKRFNYISKDLIAFSYSFIA